jgi:uncharacterized membrane protein YhaH (DUF805 family)
MNGKRYGKKRFWAVIPPWLIIGAVVILVPVFIFMAIENINRQKKQTTRLLVEKGAALIRSFEAVARREVSGLARGCLIHPFSEDWSLVVTLFRLFYTTYSELRSRHVCLYPRA